MGKNTRRETAVNRCPRCRINKGWCFCEYIKPLKLKTPVHIIMHVKELKLTSNTSHLANLMLENSKIHIRGKQDSPINYDKVLSEDYTPLYLFPDENAKELSSDFLKTLHKPAALIVPDGSWRQAKKFKIREVPLKDVQSVTIPFMGESQYALRKSPFPEAVCTYEAIARALSIIEGDKTVLNDLEAVFKELVDRTTKARIGIQPTD